VLARCDSSSDFPEDGGDVIKVGRRSERCVAKTRNDWITVGVRIRGEVAPRFSGGRSNRMPWTFATRGLERYQNSAAEQSTSIKYAYLISEGSIG
jgi:hypothetical protein